MSEGKLAAQAAHAVLGLPKDYHDPLAYSIIVLQASDAQFYHTLQNCENRGIIHYVHKDLGLTEVKPDTETCLVYVERFYDEAE